MSDGWLWDDPEVSEVSDGSHVARVGISGWVYPSWRGDFYPAGLPQKQELEHMAARLDTIEVNGTFYGLQKPASFQAWHARTPERFVFAVKGHKLVTHDLRLRDATAAVADFFASGVLALGGKLGPILWQTPPSLGFNAAAVDAFLAGLPRTIEDVRRLVADHAELDRDLRWVPPDGDGPIRHALEVRNGSFLDPQYAALLHRHGVAAVVTDTATRWPRIHEVAADHVYVRLHGDRTLYPEGYPDDTLRKWVGLVRGWLSGERCPDGEGRDVFLYFDNDVKERAPFDAVRMHELLRDAE